MCGALWGRPSRTDNVATGSVEDHVRYLAAVIHREIHAYLSDEGRLRRWDKFDTIHPQFSIGERDLNSYRSGRLPKPQLVGPRISLKRCHRECDGVLQFVGCLAHEMLPALLVLVAYILEEFRVRCQIR